MILGKTWIVCNSGMSSDFWRTHFLCGNDLHFLLLVGYKVQESYSKEAVCEFVTYNQHELYYLLCFEYAGSTLVESRTDTLLSQQKTLISCYVLLVLWEFDIILLTSSYSTLR